MRIQRESRWDDITSHLSVSKASIKWKEVRAQSERGDLLNMLKLSYKNHISYSTLVPFWKPEPGFRVQQAQSHFPRAFPSQSLHVSKQ